MEALIAANDLSGIELFLQANPGAANMEIEYGMVPLEYAVLHSTVGMAQLLYKHGARFGSPEKAREVASRLLEMLDTATQVFAIFGHVEEDQIDNVIEKLDAMYEDGTLDEIASLLVFVAISGEVTDKEKTNILNRIYHLGYDPTLLRNIGRSEAGRLVVNRSLPTGLGKMIGSYIGGRHKTIYKRRKGVKKLKTRRAKHRKLGH